MPLQLHTDTLPEFRCNSSSQKSFQFRLLLRYKRFPAIEILLQKKEMTEPQGLLSVPFVSTASCLHTIAVSLSTDRQTVPFLLSFPLLYDHVHLCKTTDYYNIVRFLICVFLYLLLSVCLLQILFYDCASEILL